MGRPYRDVSLQLIENKALSWGISQKSAPILAAIEDRKSQMDAFDQFKRTAGIGLLETTIELLAGEGAKV